MKLYAQPIHLSSGTGGPMGFRWRGRAYRVVEQLDHWRIRTRWWTQEEERDYFQVVAQALDEDPEWGAPATGGHPLDADPPLEHGVYELYQSSGQWFMGRIVD
jgi:hypothetical protein